MANDLSVLAPEERTFHIGGQDFILKPLSLKRFSILLNVVTEEVRKSAFSPAMASFMDTELNLEDMGVMEMVQMISGLFSAIPDALPRVMTVLLTGKDDSGIADFLGEEMSIATSLRILRYTVEDNEPEELIANFTALSKRVGSAMREAKATTTP